MNFYLYVDQPFTHEAEQEIIDSYDQEEHMFMWHRLDMFSYLKASDQNFQTGETGNGSIVDVVFCGITTLEGRGRAVPQPGLPGQVRSGNQLQAHHHPGSPGQCGPPVVHR